MALAALYGAMETGARHKPRSPFMSHNCKMQMATVPITSGTTERRTRSMQECSGPGVQVGHSVQLPVLVPVLPPHQVFNLA